MRDLERMRVVETELDDNDSIQMGAHLIEEKPVDVQSEVLEYDLTDSENDLPPDSDATSPAKRAPGAFGQDQSPKLLLTHSSTKKSKRVRHSTHQSSTLAKLKVITAVQKPFDEDHITFKSSSVTSSLAAPDSDQKWYEDLKK